MQRKEFIVQLIQQDLKHYQLVKGIECLGFKDEYKNDLDIFEIIFKIMRIEEEVLMDYCAAAYDDFLQRASLKPIVPSTETLIPLAEECYQILEQAEEMQKRKKE